MTKPAQHASGNDRLPLLPLKDMVVFPRMVVPLLVGRPSSIAAVEASLATGQPLFLCAQRDPGVEAPGKADLYLIGVAANILQTLRMPDGTIKIVVEGLGRARVRRLYLQGRIYEAALDPIEEEAISDDEGVAMMRMTLTQFEQYSRLSQRVAPEIVASLSSITDAPILVDLICAYLPLRFEERQELLEVVRTRDRLERLSSVLMRENELLEIEQRVRERVRDQM
ncbi:MAG TPA: LON peptidase substrate-binding domain-containing protein, partial [Candidatus Hydrogenedentes bacterium]|nr:LON peptidase substrate-binding domain-containing protein [Candidatus Hydrogenedentota bacterium]